ncbi:hypothetical protein KKF34_02025 [Myxococcota bacterium]|nr:hypothetical protein [Myxococcota bacterium]MBU1495638.1 hypothetical protein [Myxococcota bacterium]
MIKFTGFDIIIGRLVDEETLIQIFSNLFSISKERISIISDLSILLDDNQNPDIVCLYSPVYGDFLELLQISCNLELNFSSEFEILTLLADRFQTKCIISDDSFNPFAMWCAVPGNNKVELVMLNPHKIDDNYYELLESEEITHPG